ncbi:MAG TPA: DUF3656 domain-containing protein [Candidatus Nanoarchaeia archaeon]|nr:DUF3656 domain-containing protein [Candidatus Nanoarchaeia archaeon]
MDKVQLLSPVGDFESLIAAVNNGADSVYLGSKLFNARRLAHNFTADELKRAVQYAHLHNVKVFLTLNTLIKNQEIKPFLSQLAIAEQLGIDAVILQDLSFAPLIKTNFPSLAVHASTQATIMNTPSVEYWKKYVDVFVLARELTKQQVKEIENKTKAHLEIFVHGHLCISYSGQCLISSLIGKRSGNRGMCASSCRKQYNGDKYLLSAKDLCLIENVPDIIECGAKTIKIEGRMKSAEYVATTTRYYRQQLDAYYQNKKVPVTDKTIKNLKLAFNREFTSGFFADQKSIVDSAIPSKRGILLGKVVRGELLLQHPLEMYDGINIVHQGEHQGCHVKDIFVKGNKVAKAQQGQSIRLGVPGFTNGALIFLMTPLHGENLLGENTRSAVDISIKIQRQNVPLLEVTVLDKTIKIPLQSPASAPEKHPFTFEQLKKELHKFESDIFFIRNITGSTDNSFIPKSELTTFRKGLEQQLLDLLVPIAKEKKTVPTPSFKVQPAQEKKVHVQVYSLPGLREALQAKADVIYYDLFAPDLEKAAQLVAAAKRSGQKVQFYMHTPMVMVDEDMKRMAAILKTIKPDGMLVNNVGILALHLDVPLIMGYQMNIFNDQQLTFYGHQAVASIELNVKELAGFQNKKDLVYYAHGKPVVMTFKEHLGTEKLTDKEGYTFPLRVGSTGATEMLYSKHIGILQRTNEVVHAGITQLFIDAEEDVFTLTMLYKKLLAGEHIEKADTDAFRKEATVGNLVKGVM